MSTACQASWTAVVTIGATRRCPASRTGRRLRAAAARARPGLSAVGRGVDGWVAGSSKTDWMGSLMGIFWTSVVMRGPTGPRGRRSAQAGAQAPPVRAWPCRAMVRGQRSGRSAARGGTRRGALSGECGELVEDRHAHDVGHGREGCGVVSRGRAGGEIDGRDAEFGGDPEGVACPAAVCRRCRLR